MMRAERSEEGTSRSTEAVRADRAPAPRQEGQAARSAAHRCSPLPDGCQSCNLTPTSAVRREQTMSIFKHLGMGIGAPGDAARISSADAESIRRIVQALDRIEPRRAKQIAAFAFVLSRVAGADLDISHDEGREMERIV